jgi:signal transduction histidine kinase
MAEAPAGPSLTPPGDKQFVLLLDLIQEINQAATPERVFGLVADALRRIFGYDRFALVLVQPDGSLAVIEKRGLSARYLAEVRQRLPESPGARALAEGRPMYIRDVTVDSSYWPLQAAAGKEGFRTVLILPLFAGIEPLGYLIMYHDDIREYTPAEIVLAQALAQQAGSAVQNARLLASAQAHRAELESRFQQRVAEAEAIDEIVLRIASSLELETTLQAITDAAATLSGAATASLYLRAEDSQYRAVAAHGIPLERLQAVVLSPSNGLLSEMIQTGRPAQVMDFAQEARSTRRALEEVRRLDVHAALGVPLMENGDCVGALYVGGQQAASFPPETVRILLRLASFARVAMQNARRFSDIQARALERERERSLLLAELLDLSLLLNSDLSIPTLIERVVEAAMELVGARSGTLGLLEGDKLVFRRFHVPEGWIDFDVALSRGEGTAGHVWETMAPYASNDVLSDPHVMLGIQQRIGFTRLATVPVVDREGNLVGTLGVYDPVEERDFGQGDIEALQLLAHQVAIAIENARLNQMKDAFLSIVSHELKTPVTSIKGFTQMLQRRIARGTLEEGTRYLAVINQQADRLTALINDLLDLSRIQMGRFNFETELLDYSRLVREVVSEMQLIVPDNPIMIDAPNGLMVRGNSNRLHQVLVNLIDNAVKYGPEGGVIHVAVALHGEVATTCVRDEGSGLPTGEEDSVFSPYYQLQRGNQATGLGLGLYISRQIVEAHGGTIWLDAEEGVTKFCFTVPALTDRSRVSESRGS